MSKSGEIISYREMCDREDSSLQRGMNFFRSRDHSVVLMSLRKDAPYADRVEDEGRTLVYEGHDAPRRAGGPEPKQVDQPEFTPKGSLTENGVFHEAAQLAKRRSQGSRVVRVYEKLMKGTWAYNGRFLLVDSWRENDGRRSVFKFKLVMSDSPESEGSPAESFVHNRMIPSAVKHAVFKRDRGRCVICGEPDGLHFDHDLPFSKGGSSVSTENIRLLCARHNLQKGARIE